MCVHRLWHMLGVVWLGEAGSSITRFERRMDEKGAAAPFAKLLKGGGDADVILELEEARDKVCRASSRPS